MLNRVGSPRHEEVLRAAAAEVGLPVLGALPRRDALAVPSRHLGLVTAAEHGTAATAAVDAMAELVAAHVDLDAVTALARPLAARPCVVARCRSRRGRPRTSTAHGRRRAEAGAGAPAGRAAGAPPVRVAVFGGPAFTFGYAEHVELLTAAGAEVVVVDPLRDTRLPTARPRSCCPAASPRSTSARSRPTSSCAPRCGRSRPSGAPVHAECGGLLYLCATLDGAPMCDVLPAHAAMTARLTLGYRDAVALTPSPLYPAGARVTGHEFHRCAVTPRAAAPAWAWRGGEPEGFVHGGVHASFLHTHPAGHPEAVARLVAAAAR